jgi:hypothetical protein
VDDFDVDPAAALSDGRALLVETSNPNDPTHEDLGELLEELREAARDLPVEILYAPDEVYGAGTTLWHMVYIWLPDLKAEKDLLWGAATAASLTYLKGWRRRRPQEKNRPGQVKVLYGPKGKVISKVTVSPDEEEPTVQEPDAADHPRPLRFLRRSHSRGPS